MTELKRKGWNKENAVKVFYTAHPEDQEHYMDHTYNYVLEGRALALLYFEDESQVTDEAYKKAMDDAAFIVMTITMRFFEEDCRARTVAFPYALEKDITILPLVIDEETGDAFEAFCEEHPLLKKHSENRTGDWWTYFVERAAEREVLTAVDLLISIYDDEGNSTGIVDCHRKKIEICKREFAKYRDILRGDDLFWALITFADYLTESEKSDEAEPLLHRALQLSDVLLEETSSTLPFYLASAVNQRLANLEDKRNNMEEAARYSQEAFNGAFLFDQHTRSVFAKKRIVSCASATAFLARKRNDVETEKGFFETAVAYLECYVEDEEEEYYELHMNLGYLTRELARANNRLGALDEALSQLQKSYEAFSKAAERDSTSISSIELISTLFDLGNLCLLTGELSRAADFHEKAHSLSLKASADSDDPFDQEIFATCWGCKGDSLLARGALEEAEDCYKRCLAIYTKIYEEDASTENELLLAMVHESFGKLYLARNKKETACEYFKKCFFIRQRASLLETTDERISVTAESHLYLGECLADTDPGAAGLHYKKAAALLSQLSKEAPSYFYEKPLADAYGGLFELALAEGRREEAAEYAEKARHIHLELHKKCKCAESTYALSTDAHRLGRLAALAGDTADAKKRYEKAIAALSSVAKEQPAPKYKKELGKACLSLAAILPSGEAKRSLTEKGKRLLA